MKIRLTMPDRHIANVLLAVPNIETIDDPEYVGEDVFPPQIPKYTDQEWMREIAMRHLKRQVEVGKNKAYRKLEPVRDDADIVIDRA